MKRIARALVIIVVVLVAVVLCLPLFVHANDFRPTIESKLTQALGRPVKVGNLKLAILSGGVTADD
ncbi:MAG: outer membrane assembly protein AsmA, partial [Bryobacteraceae bacterium]